MISVGIVGGAGYTAGELIRLLVHHPHADISFVQSTSQSGKKVAEIHKDLLGDLELRFISEPDFRVDVVFLCMGHGKSREFISSNNVPENVKIIDLSTDFRHSANAGDFIYGLPELNEDKIGQANYIANPGCFATCIQLGLLPLAKAGLIKHDVHVHAITGSTGAGVGLSPTSHFSWRNNNVSIYKPFEHQHMTEIRESLQQLAGEDVSTIHFLPVRGNFTRGIFASMYTPFQGSTEEALSLFNQFYKNHPFVQVTEDTVSLKQVVNTNKCILQVQVIKGQVLITSVIDNLLKGASGQAVQNMNILFGWDQQTGLQLKSTAF